MMLKATTNIMSIMKVSTGDWMSGFHEEGKYLIAVLVVVVKVIIHKGHRYKRQKKITGGQL